MKQRYWYSREAQALIQKTHESDPVRAITKLAAALIDETGLDQPPFDPCIMASFQGVQQVRYIPMRSAARIVPGEGGLIIEVNETHSRGKQNFSIDHEIAHTLMPTYTGWLIDDAVTGHFGDASEEELLCDIGASALLLDPRWLRPYAQEAGPSMATVLWLAQMFGASLQATVLKLAELDLWPCSYVLWEPGYRKGERVEQGQPLLPGMNAFGQPQPKFRVTYVYSAPSFGYFVPHNKSIEDSSLVVQCCSCDDPTVGVHLFDFGRERVPLYCENIYVPYRAGGETRSRILSLLLPTPQRASYESTMSTYQIEIL